MFENVGAKVQTLAKVICWLGIVGSVIGGIVMIAQGGSGILIGIGTAIGGAFFSWLGSLGLYAIGEAAENSSIAANLAAKADSLREKERRERENKNA